MRSPNFESDVSHPRGGGETGGALPAGSPRVRSSGAPSQPLHQDGERQMTHASHQYTRPATGQPPHHPHRHITALFTASLPSPCVTTPSHRPSTPIHPTSTMRVKNARAPMGRPKSGSHAGKLRSFARGWSRDLQVTLLSWLF